jgi:signal transduction histidine kinase
VLERNARSQAQIVSDLLDVSRVVTGNMQLAFERVAVSVVVREAAESLMPTARVKGVELTMDVPDVEGIVLGDPHRLRQVAWNLLSNAVKFTPPGGSVRVSLRAANGGIRLEVSDTGIGMSSDVLPYIFQRFHQGDSSLTRPFGGLGLGLAIVRHLVELHGGTVAASSSGPGHGSSFVVRLPIGKEPHRNAAPPGNVTTLPASPLHDRR